MFLPVCRWSAIPNGPLMVELVERLTEWLFAHICDATRGVSVSCFRKIIILPCPLFGYNSTFLRTHLHSESNVMVRNKMLQDMVNDISHLLPGNSLFFIDFDNIARSIPDGGPVMLIDHDWHFNCYFYPGSLESGFRHRMTVRPRTTRDCSYARDPNTLLWREIFDAICPQ